MPEHKWVARGSVFCLTALLLAGLFYFAGLTGGHSYPALSTLNSDRLGAKLLYDALTQLPQVTVTRNYLPLSRWNPRDATIFYLGASPDRLNAMQPAELAALERLAGGNRLVLSFVEDEFYEEEDLSNLPPVNKRWGIRLFYKATGHDDETELTLEHDSAWRAVAGLSDTWQKPLGGGSLIVSLHGEQFSNENIATGELAQSLLPPLISGSGHLAFEEAHMGIQESGSIVGLARRYRLQGLAAGLLLLVVLFLWNRSVSFPPARKVDGSRPAAITGTAAQGMLSGLLARHLKPQGLLEACVSEWNRVSPKRRLTLSPQAKLDIVAAYRQLQETLQTKGGRL